MQRLLATAAIVIAGLITYSNSFTGVFVFDDRPSIIDNPYVRNPAPWAHPWQAMLAPRNVTVSGRPVASFSFALNYALAPTGARNTFDPPSPGSLESRVTFERNVWGYHAANLAIHLLAALALFGIVRRTLETPALRAIAGSAATPLAFLIALAWTVHPLQTGSVTYIVQRVESLMGLFLLLTLYCSIRANGREAELKLGPTYGKRAGAKSTQRYVGPSFSSANPAVGPSSGSANPTVGPSSGSANSTVGPSSGSANSTVGPSSGSAKPAVGPSFSSASTLWTLAAIAFCALGMGTKEVMAGAPLLVLLWDWTFLPGTFSGIVKRRWPLYVGLAATWIILGSLVAMNARPLSSGFGFAEWPWWRYLATETGVLAHYLKMAFVPDPLVLDYDWRAVKQISDILLPGAIIVTLGVLTLWQLARRHPLGFAGAWFFVILAPSSSILPIITEIAAEHRMYLPLAAVITTVTVSAYALSKRWAFKSWARDVAFWMALVIIGAYAWTANARNVDYMSDERIWFDTLQKQPLNARARNNYAADLLKTGQAKAAAEHLQVAVAESPNSAEAHANLGVALATQGQYPEALVHFERALEIDPFYTSVFENIGEAYGTQNQLAKAAKYFQKALDQKPDDLALLNKAAWILATAVDPAARDGARALVLAQHAVDLSQRHDASSLDSLAAALAELGRFDEATATGSEALAAAKARGDQRYPAELEQRLALYRAKKPFRQ